MRRNGFSLVELGIVLVIIGFLAAAIVSGKSLVEQAQIRTYISEFTALTQAYNNFVFSYGAPPGDIQSYSAFATSASQITTDPSQTPYGNGDGLIVSQNNGLDETRLALRDLTVAGMIKNNIATVASQTNMIPGQSAPASTISAVNGYMFLSYALNGTPVTGVVNINFAGTMSDIFTDNPELGASYNVLYLGAASINSGETLLGASLSTPIAYAIDRKIDDGAIVSGVFSGATTGKFRALNGENVTGCAAGTQYNISSATVPMCLVGIKMD
ncbi:MAG: type II secretion system protein [Rickettsiales bacterium]